MRLDHLSIAAPTLAEGVAYVEATLGVRVPFGTHHPEMGTYNHRVRIADDLYLEVIAVDPNAGGLTTSRWFGLDDAMNVRSQWTQGVRLRHWVVREGIAPLPEAAIRLFQFPIMLGAARFFMPMESPTLDSSGMPCLIDRAGNNSPASRLPDCGIHLAEFVMEHPEPERLRERFAALGIDNAPIVRRGDRVRYHASFTTPSGVKVMA